MEDPHLIVGLGNPGGEYAATRHNVGFMVCERFASRHRAAWKLEKKFKARLARVDCHGRRVWLCQPQTYMNASGEAVQAVRTFYQVATDHLLLVLDDADLPLGEVRLRPKGGTGGHHGLESVEQQLGGRDYARQRIGIGRQAGDRREITGHVLGVFRPNETELLEQVLTRSCDQIDCWLESGLQQAMNRYNGVIES